MFLSNTRSYQLDISDGAKEFLEDKSQQTKTTNTLVFVNEINENTHALLTKILGAVQLSSENYLIIDQSQHPEIKVNNVANSFTEVKFIIAFGLNANQLGLNSIDLKYRSFPCGNYKVLFADDLTNIANEAKLKNALWQQLKKQYNV